MQGRLSPAPPGRPQAFPWSTWRDEFERAAACGFDRIEWLVTDEHFDRNPLCTAAGADEIRERMHATGVRVLSVCADFCIARPLVRVADPERQSTVERLTRLVDRIAAIGGDTVLVPVLEQGAITDDHDSAIVLAALAPVLNRAEAGNIRIGIETDLAAARLRELMTRANSPALRAYYDLGNATAAGCHAADDLRELGPLLAGVHLKDRIRGGGSVPLGQGDADFPGFFAALAEIGYAGSLILETPVGDDAIAMAGRNLAFVQKALR